MRFLFGIFTIFFFVSTATAEIYNCDGKWTNKPCQGKATKVLKESTLSKSIKEKPELDQKIEALAKFKRFNMQAEENHGIFVDFPPLEEFCLEKKTTVELCEEKLDRARKALEGKVVEKNRVENENR